MAVRLAGSWVSLLTTTIRAGRASCSSSPQTSAKWPRWLTAKVSSKPSALRLSPETTCTPALQTTARVGGRPALRYCATHCLTDSSEERPPRHVGVLGGLRASNELGRAALLKEAAGTGEAVARHIGHRGVKRRQRATPLVLREQTVAYVAEQVEGSVLAVELQVRRRVARVGCHRQDSRARRRQPPLQLRREEQVGELGLAVGAPRDVALALPVEVIEIDRAHA